MLGLRSIAAENVAVGIKENVAEVKDPAVVGINCVTAVRIPTVIEAVTGVTSDIPDANKAVTAGSVLKRAWNCAVTGLSVDTVASNVAVTGLYVATMPEPVAWVAGIVTTEANAVIKLTGAVGTSVASDSFWVAVPRRILNLASGDGVIAVILLFLTRRLKSLILRASSEKNAGFVVGMVLSPSKNLPLDTSRNSS